MEITLSRALRVDTTSYLFRFLLGPVMLSLALLMAPSVLSGVVAAVGLLVVFQFGFKGVLATLGFLFLILFIHHDRFLWEATWNIAAGSSLFITMLGLEETQRFIEEEKKALTTSLELLKVDYATHQQKNREEIKGLEEQQRLLSSKLEESTSQCLSLKQLVQATTIESDKLYKEVDELCKLRREDDILIIALRQKMEEGEARLKELNEVRVANFQLKQLVQEPEVEEVPALHPLQEKLQSLEEQKAILKQEYEALDDKEAMKLKKKEIVGIDRELFNIKKEMRDLGLFFSNVR